MAWQQFGPFIAGDAGADLSGKLYLAAKINGSGEVVPVAAITDPVAGIINDDPAAAGRAATLQHRDVSKCIVGATAVTVGTMVEIAADGRVLPSATGVNATQVGMALESGSANDVIPVLLALPAT